MKVLCNLDLNHNSLLNATTGGSIPVILYEDTFERTSSSDSNYEEISGSDHGIVNPIVQLFEVDTTNNVDTAVIADIEVDTSDNDVKISFGEETVAGWDDNSVTYKVRIIGQDANAASGEGT